MAFGPARRRIRDNVRVMENLIANPYWVAVSASEKGYADQFKQTVAYETNKSAYDARIAYTPRDSSGTSATLLSTSVGLPPNLPASLPNMQTDDNSVKDTIINVREHIAEDPDPRRARQENDDRKAGVAALTSSRTVIVDFNGICSSDRDAEVLTLALTRINIALHSNLRMIVRGLNID